MVSPTEIIRAKRDGRTLLAAQIGAFVSGLVNGSWSVCDGMDGAETVALTPAMTHSGEVLDWREVGFDGPILDKHSTGGVGDKVSLMLAPIVAACGATVPMISGCGLGHTGGTLDKLEALPGYDIDPARDRLHATLRDAGPRLNVIRDVTATMERVPLITASILSKKLAAGL